MNSRKRTILRLKERFAISITPIPKVHIRVQFRSDGSWHWSFGYRSHEALGFEKIKESGKWAFAGGQDYCVNDLWRWLKEYAYREAIHPLDIVQ
ncbi:hypothetical protein [Parapedobacter indicus]|uniref:hypothetical protein n=1 Tax=Parapedobacter indicus TaxID=1477437 RepID=UPI000B8170A3|nr:hypothetical protein [Parapedobacter indicus]